jgi:nitrite reductase/ring-hydroxylating ferredoxin subunit
MNLSEILRRAKITNLKGYFYLKFIIFALFFSFYSCDDDDSSNIPLVEVNFTINIEDPNYINLQSVGGSVEVSGGSRGIILYRLSSTEIRAFDRHCTFQPSSSCAIVTVDPNGITASDQCCGSSFLLSDGNVTNPPATVPLKRYNTFFDGTLLTVTN